MKKKKLPQEVYAAIAMALYDYQQEQLHDSDDMKLTIKRGNTPSAWALKSALLRATPNKIIY